MHMCLSALAPLHTQCMFVQRLLWLLQQAMAPGSTPQVCSQDWDRCDSVFQLFISFLHFVIFKFPSSGVQGSLSSSAPCCRAVGRHSLHGRQPATRASRQEEQSSQHPHPRTFKLLKPAHHSAASLPQLLFISLENVRL